MGWKDLSERWQNYFINELHNISEMSKDENTKVGSIIIDTEKKTVVTKGFNDLPRGVKHLPERNKRPVKYFYTVHAEQNALYNALYIGASVSGLTMLSTLYACSTCAGGIIQSGIKEVVCPTPNRDHVSLAEEFPVTDIMFEESGVNVIFDERLANGKTDLSN